MATVISHFYNEEFLLPIWLDHHKKRFNSGVLIDFKSTDKSRNLIKQIVPDWTVVEANQDDFDAAKLDEQVLQIEQQISGPKIALTVTEFFIGNPDEFQENVIVPTVDLINMKFDGDFDISIPWHEQRHWGYHYFQEFPGRGNKRGRLFHASVGNYTPGRHYECQTGGPFLIYRVANCLVNKKMIERKLQIQTKIPDSDKKLGFGVQHHNFGKGLTELDIIQQEQIDRELATDLSSVLKGAILREDISFNSKSYTLENKIEFLCEMDLRLQEKDKHLKETINLKKDNLNLMDSISELNLKIDQQQKEFTDLRNKYESLVNSRSWKITKFLRVYSKYGSKFKAFKKSG